MIGQKKLLEQLNKFTLDTFPRSTLFVAEKGMGKHTLVKELQSTIINLPILDISDKISNELIEEIYRSPNPAIYLIDLSMITEKDQNTILKFVEEPLNNSFIILLATSRANVLQTILNRCVVFEFAPYTRDELASFLTIEEDVDLLLRILRSPGKILNTNIKGLADIFDVCNKLIDKLTIANYPNTLTICNKINFKENYDRFDIDIFFDVLSYQLLQSYVNGNNKAYTLYLITQQYQTKLIDKRLNLEIFFESFLTQLWKESRGLR